MDNPFKKRRTELITDRKAMLGLVSPAPIDEFFKVDRNNVIEKLTMVIGTPGCGKTTIAQVVEFESLAMVAVDSTQSTTRDLIAVLSRNKLIVNDLPALLGHRLAMTTNFRDIWELPYSESTRHALLRAFLQSKAILGWFRQLEGIQVSLNDVDIVLGPNSESVAAATHAHDAKTFREYARTIESAIFRVVTALVPPGEAELASDFLNTRYDIFEVLLAFRVNRWPEGYNQIQVELRPMMIIDDAHELHPSQFVALTDWLKLKAIGVSRWLMCRPDVVSPQDYRDALAKDISTDDEQAAPGSLRGRDYVIKLMQLGNSRDKRFKLIATDIAKRYIRELPELSRQSISDLGAMLDVQSPKLPEGQLRQLEDAVDKQAKASHFAPALVATLKARVPATARPDEALSALRILMTREANRTPQLGLLPEEDELDEPVTEERVASSSLVDGARIHLLHQYSRPYYFGSDKLFSASNANIEQFLRLASVLVDEVLARVIRGKSPELDARAQHKALVGQAEQAIRDWDFPYHTMVRMLVENIATRCLERTLRPNAPLDTGANAIGVPQDEMDKILSKSERLARVLHFAFAYKALVFVPQYRCKGKYWCLLELGALPCMKYGLTLNRGGFIEDDLSGVKAMLSEEGSLV
jgi:hypothetical protein